jgi:uncharacterized membrane protein YphA (DoxX/SURF4 family)
MNLLAKLISTPAPNPVLLIRLTVGAVFLSEGIQKFLFLLIADAGAWSLDAWLHKRPAHHDGSDANAPLTDRGWRKSPACS